MLEPAILVVLFWGSDTPLAVGATETTAYCALEQVYDYDAHKQDYKILPEAEHCFYLDRKGRTVYPSKHWFEENIYDETE